MQKLRFFWFYRFRQRFWLPDYMSALDPKTSVLISHTISRYLPQPTTEHVVNAMVRPTSRLHLQFAPVWDFCQKNRQAVEYSSLFNNPANAMRQCLTTTAPTSLAACSTKNYKIAELAELSTVNLQPLLPSSMLPQQYGRFCRLLSLQQLL